MASVGDRRHWAIGAAALVVAGAGLAIYAIVPRDRATELDVGEVVERFRTSTVPTAVTTAAAGTDGTVVAPVTTTSPATVTAPATTAATAPPATTAPPTPAVRLPAPGVYVYRTEGGEQIDVLTGARHDYPAETTITVLAEGCGVLLRWDALQERREEWRLCATPEGVELQPFAMQHHEFYGQAESEDVICDVGVVVVPVDDRPRPPVPQTCTLAEDPWLPVWEVLGTETRTIDGTTVEVRHVRMTIDDNDEYFEHNVADWWLAPNGLPVELTVTKDSRSPSPVGPVVYLETLQLDLTGLDPLR